MTDHSIAMSALFISDLHLSEQTPENTEALFEFIRQVAPSADDLYVLGDLFEYWAGDDDAHESLSQKVANAIRELSESGVHIHFLAGNRDFLLGEAYAHEAGIEILPDPSLVDLGGRIVLLSHGDSLCTDDSTYQSYRRQVRDRAWQAEFLSRPLVERKQIIADLRRHSESAKQHKAMQIMDVNASAVEALLREHAYPTLIHGHTHRPAHHIHQVDGHTCSRWVLADWHGGAAYLRWDGSTFANYPHDCPGLPAD